ncbi:MAG: GNAT family N-acetyltransferase [Acidobacteriia bacterium]|nr:GNAT family N-acetyltransferase [Terriglobia bacterium]
MPGIRPFVQADVQQVADLVWKVLHEKKGSSPPSLKIYFEELFLHNPWLDDGILSRVYEDAQGKIVGFFGAVPRRMSIQGKTIRLAFGSNFVVDPESRASMAAIQLVRAFMKGSQDVSITDSANENSRQFLRSLGFHVVPVYSLQWARPLRPSLYVLHALARLKKSRLIASLASISRPFCSVADALAAKVSLSPLRQSPPTTTSEELDTEMLLQCLATIPSKHWLLPEYDRTSLEWTLDFLAKRKVFGELRRVLVRNKERKIIGWYIYYVAPGAVGEVVQIGAEGPAVGAVLDQLFYDAWKHGLIGLHGRLEPQFMQELTLKSCFFFRNGSWTLIHCGKPELAGLLESGTAFFSRLDGEWALRSAIE